jgi:lipopolysaccharide export system permease protein
LIAVTRLDRYIISQVFALTGIVALALTAIYTFVAFVADLRDVGEGSYGMLQLGLYVILLIPQSIYLLLPIIAMLGTLMGLGTLAAQSEITAMRAAGVSLLRIGGSTLLAGSLLGICSLVLGDWLAPWAKVSAEQMQAEKRLGIKPGTLNVPVWLREGESIIHIKSLVTETQFTDAEIFTLAPDLSIKEIVQAGQGSYQSGRWIFHDVRRTAFTPEGTKVSRQPTLDWGDQPEPDVLRLFLLRANAISIHGLLQLMGYLRDNGLDDRAYAFELWRKLMAPFTVMAMMLFTIPFVMGPLRSTGAGQRLLVGVLIGVGFYVVNEVTGNTGQLYGWNPLLSAMLPTFLLVLIALWRLRRLR